MRAARPCWERKLTPGTRWSGSEEDTLVTLKVARALPVGGSEPERLLVEATGSDAVICAEPMR